LDWAQPRNRSAGKVQGGKRQQREHLSSVLGEAVKIAANDDPAKNDLND
jgi:hypothetical protein